MEKVVKLARREGRGNLLLILLSVVAFFASIIWLQAVAEGTEGLVVIVWIYMAAFWAAGLVPLLVSGVGLLFVKKRGFNVLSIIGSVGKVISLVVVGLFGVASIVDTIAAVPYVVLDVLYLLSFIGSIFKCIRRSRLIRKAASAQEAAEVAPASDAASSQDAEEASSDQIMDAKY